MLGERSRDRLRIGLLGRIKMLRLILDDLVPSAAEQPLGSLVRSDETALVKVVHQDRVGRLLDQEPEALLAGAQVFLGALALGDVVAGPGHADRLAALVADDFAAGMDDPLRLVRPEMRNSMSNGWFRVTLAAIASSTHARSSG